MAVRFTVLQVIHVKTARTRACDVLESLKRVKAKKMGEENWLLGV